MEIWNYHPETGELLGSSTADPSPLEPGVFLIPAYATTVTPPATQPGKAIVFADGGWDFVEDHRGEVWWKPEGEEVTIATIGAAAIDGLLSEAPPPPPPPPPLTPEQKLAASGLTVDELKSLLGIN